MKNVNEITLKGYSSKKDYIVKPILGCFQWIPTEKGFNFIRTSNQGGTIIEGSIIKFIPKTKIGKVKKDKELYNINSLGELIGRMSMSKEDAMLILGKIVTDRINLCNQHILKGKE